MRKTATAIVAIVLALLFVFQLTACFPFEEKTDDVTETGGTEITNPDEIVSFSIESEPTKKTYITGERFVAAGGSVKLTRKDGREQTVPFSDKNVLIRCPYVFEYWTERQYIGVQYHDPITETYTKELFFVVEVSLDTSDIERDYKQWSNDFLFLSYPDDYSKKLNANEYILRLTKGKKTITIDEFGSISALRNTLEMSTSEMDAHYLEQYRTMYREEYDDNTLEVTVTNHRLSSAERSALQYFNECDGFHQIITIKKTGTFLGLGNWTEHIDFYVITGNNNSVRISFAARNTSFTPSEISDFFSHLHIKYTYLDVYA
jgi:hypothetical protein